jgi:hypothetical protein
MSGRVSATDVTLQINLSAGDVTYARMTVPALVAAHHGHVKEVVGIVDCCRPQQTQVIDPDTKFPVEVFAARVATIREIAERFLREGVFDRVIYVEPGDPRIDRLLSRYIGWPVTETHDCFGCGLVSYLYGFDEVTTRFLLHYDADMLLHQEPGYDWIVEGVARLQADPSAISATPRVSPPYDSSSTTAGPSRVQSDVWIERGDGYWRLGWFSARCYLIDVNRLNGWLPLIGLNDWRYFIEVIARKVLARGYPPHPEMMIHRRAQRLRAYRIDLMSEQSFLIHPFDKGDRFVRLLPDILESIHRGDIPGQQRGWENLDLDAWEEHLGRAREAARSAGTLA